MADLFRSRRSFLRGSAALGLSQGIAARLGAQMQGMPGMGSQPAKGLHPAQTMRAHPPAPPKIPLLNAFTMTPFVDALPRLERAQPVEGAHYRVRMREVEAQLHRDMKPTRLWSYGDGANAPLIDVAKGQAVTVEWRNDLPRKHFLPVDHTLHECGPEFPEVRAIVHVHGGRNRSEDDGYPEQWYPVGHSRTCHYPNTQDAAMLWYHDHAMGINRLNMYAGLFGTYIVRDEEERALGLPDGEHEVPLLLCDRQFTRDGQLYYPVSWDPKKPWVPEVYGDFLLVNGKVRPYLEVEPRQYRFRVLNASNARFYTLSLSRGVLQQIGSDQGLLAHAVGHAKPLVVAPSERVDLLVDFSQMRGEKVYLRNAAFPMVEFRVGSGAAQAPKPLPATLRQIARTPEASAARSRQITLHEYDDDYARSMVMLLNRKRWHEPVTERVKLGETEIWEFTNLTEDTHPMHMHLVRFQVLDRRPFEPFAFLIDKKMQFTGPALPAAAHELGWKDTVQCPGSMVTRVIVRFDGYPGKYLYHCHILEHEANDMMRPFEVLG